MKKTRHPACFSLARSSHVRGLSPSPISVAILSPIDGGYVAPVVIDVYEVGWREVTSLQITLTYFFSYLEREATGLPFRREGADLS